ncbi:hypothetical protein [Shewanella colwelliana]|uniref:hypothetical protein n=1 Tax=Shewanella colwelliana TaxID=23 RepID=UPI003736E4F8
MRQYLFFILTIILITACVPTPRSYHKPYYDGGTLISGNCSVGQKEKLEIELPSDALLTVKASSSNSAPYIGQIYVYVEVKAPEGISLQLANDKLIIKDLESTNKWSIQLDDIQVNLEGEYHDLPPLTKVKGQTNFYEVLGGRKRYFNSGFSFSVVSNKTPTFLSYFSLELPIIVVNGVKKNLSLIEFKYTEDIGIAPVNC